MRILVVCQHYFPENFSITPLCEAWVRRGHDVFVVTDKPNYGYGRILEGYEKVNDEVINGVRVHRVNVVPRREGKLAITKTYLSYWANSKRYIRRLKEPFDVVYSMSISPVISVAGANLYAKKHHVKHVLHCLDLWPESVVITHAIKKESLWYRLLYRWSKATYAKTSKILISSPSFRDYFRDVLHLGSLPMEYVPQPPLMAEQQGESIGYSHAYNLVYAGNIGTLQLVENLAKAVKIASAQKDLCFHVIGMGARTAALKDWIAQNGMEDRVIFYGTKPRAVTACYFANATGIVVSLVNEGTVGRTIPSKLVTSLAYGKPILACIGGDGKEILEKAGGSVFASGETPEMIAKAMLCLCEKSEQERSQMGEKNRFFFEENYTIESIADKISDILAAK